MSHRYGCVIHWFRRDLRLTDNTGLYAASQAAPRVVTVYIRSQWKKHHAWTGPPRQAFLSGCLQSLQKDIKAVGGQLICRSGDAVAGLEKLVHETGAEAIFYNRDPDPHGTKTEARLACLADQLGINLHGFKDTVLHEKDEALTLAGKPYRVFSPYRRAWEKLPKPVVQPRVTALHSITGLHSDPIPTLATWGLKNAGTLLPEAGEPAARKRMEQALRKLIPRYHITRNRLAGESTSRLSPDLRMGTISVRELYHRVVEISDGSADPDVKKSCATYLGELAWREFYMQLLGHFPGVLEQEFNPQWLGLPWSYDPAAFQRWKDGRTGFPIVDAGMREMKATGQMHNRARMITAMFLTKDLHIDWRLGEQYFMQSLIDGEIASNNGGWQWSAGTGADAAPWFRIQNPWSQTKAYDPHGDYIRQWVPELKPAPLPLLLDPPTPGSLRSAGCDYPDPMVDHAEERTRTLAIFDKHRKDAL